MTWSGSHTDSVQEAKIRFLASLSAKRVLSVTHERGGWEEGGRVLLRTKRATVQTQRPDQRGPCGGWAQ